MKQKTPCILLILFLISCGTANRKEAPEPVEGEVAGIQSTESANQTDPPELQNVLSGQWRTEGNVGVVPKWLEFDPPTKAFYGWLEDEPRPSHPTGNYKIIADTLLELSYSKYNERERFAFDSINQNYLDMWSLGVSAGNLVYKRTSYK